MTPLAALAAALMVWIALPGRPPLTRLQPPRESRPARGRSLTQILGLGLVVASWIAGSLGGTSACTIVVSVGLALILAQHLVLKSRRRGKLRAQRTELVAACEALAARLRLGLVPTAALRAVAAEFPILRTPAAEVAAGGDPSLALQRAAEGGADIYRQLATAWQVAATTGASMTDSIDALADQVRADHDLARIVDGELAAARATGRLLSALPAVGLLMGFVLGGNPVAFLTGSLVGQGCLIAGTMLAAVGVLWTERLADRASGGAR